LGGLFGFGGAGEMLRLMLEIADRIEQLRADKEISVEIKAALIRENQKIMVLCQQIHLSEGILPSE
jgi:hypothetical protein